MQGAMPEPSKRALRGPPLTPAETSRATVTSSGATTAHRFPPSHAALAVSANPVAMVSAVGWISITGGGGALSPHPESASAKGREASRRRIADIPEI